MVCESLNLTTLQYTVSQKILWGITFGRELNLAVWRLTPTTAELESANMHMYV